MVPSQLGQYFEDFVVGDVVLHQLSKTVFESDNNIFSLLTMNHHPIHTNAEFARASEAGKIIVVGTYVFSLVVGISVPDISGKAIVNIGYQNIEHIKPVFINDTIYARSRILETKQSISKPDRGVVVVETIGFNQFEVDVLSLTRKVLVPKKK